MNAPLILESPEQAATFLSDPVTEGMLDGLDAMLSIIQMPPGIPTATVGVNGAMNAAILACEMISLCDEEVAARRGLAQQVVTPI